MMVLVFADRAVPVGGVLLNFSTGNFWKYECVYINVCVCMYRYMYVYIYVYLYPFH